MRITLVALLAISVSAALAQNAYFTGELTGSDPTWNRPFEDGSGLSGVGTNVFYDVQPFYVTISSSYTAETTSNAEYDTFLFIYSDPFNSASPLTNYVGGDDDFTGAFVVLPGPFSVGANGTGSGGAQPASQFSASLTAGVQYYAINTSFGNGDTGTYFTGIGNGQGEVVLGLVPVVPEPATMAVLGLGTLALLRRRRKS